MRKVFLAITVFVGLAFGAWVGVMWLDVQKPYDYDGPNSRIFPDPAQQGSMVTADWALSKVHRICPGQVQRFFTDADTGKIVATMNTTEIARAVKVGDNRIPRAFELPPGLPPRVGYFAEVNFQCNLLHYLFPLRVTTPVITFRMAN